MSSIGQSYFSMSSGSTSRRRSKEPKNRPVPWRSTLQSIVIPIIPKPDFKYNETAINGAVGAISFFNLEQNMKNSGYDLSSRIYCWIDTKDRESSKISDLVAAALYELLTPFCVDTDRIFTLSDPSPRQLTDAIRRCESTSISRLLFYYNGHGAVHSVTDECFRLLPGNVRSNSELNIKDFLTSVTSPLVVIFDADFSGSLCNTFASAPGNPDRFGFFSCQPNEALPHRLGLPADLFTSCLITPALMAMLWSSRQFFVFDTGLHTLQPSYFKDRDGQLPHLIPQNNTIDQLLRCIVLAMACEVLTPEQLYNFFHRDQKVSKLSVNFCFARRIASEIGFKPMCYPPMPDFSRHPVWEFFDLYLDRIIASLPEDEETFTAFPKNGSNFPQFLADALISVEESMKLKFLGAEPYELALMPLILAEPTLTDRALTVLVTYLDTGDHALRSRLCTSFLTTLLGFANPEYLLRTGYCVSKLLTYGQTHIDEMYHFISTCTSIVPNLLNGPSHCLSFAYIILTLELLIYNEKAIIDTSFVYFGIDRLPTSTLVEQFWILVFLTKYFEYNTITFNNLICSKLRATESAPSAEVRAAFISAYSGFLISTISNFDKSDLISVIQHSVKDTSHLVRMELAFLLQHFFTVYTGPDDDFLQSVVEITRILSLDGQAEISSLGKQLYLYHSPDTVKPLPVQSCLIYSAISAFLEAKFPKLESYVIPPFCTTRSAGFEIHRPVITTDETDPSYKKPVLVERAHLDVSDVISTNIVFLPGDIVVFGTSEGEVCVYNYGSHELVNSFRSSYFFSSAASKHRLTSILEISNESILVVTAGGDYAIITNVSDEVPIVSDCFRFTPPERALQPIPVVEFCRERGVLYVADEPGEVIMWSLDACMVTRVIKHGVNPFTAIRIMPHHPSIIGLASTNLIFLDIENEKELSTIDKMPLSLCSYSHGFLSLFADKTAAAITPTNPVKIVPLGKASGGHLGAAALWAPYSILVKGDELIFMDLAHPDAVQNVKDKMVAKIKTDDFSSLAFNNWKTHFGFVVNKKNLYIGEIVA